jgi:hypothetical protein
MGLKGHPFFGLRIGIWFGILVAHLYFSLSSWLDLETREEREDNCKVFFPGLI